MAFQPDELEQLRSLVDQQQDTILNKVQTMLDDQRTGIMTDTQITLNGELREVKDKLVPTSNKDIRESITFATLVSKANEIKKKYEAQNSKLGRKNWETQDYYQGFVGDVGDLGKLIMAKNNLREYKDQDKKLAHELADCLWSILVLADELHIDLEKEFLKAKLSTIEKKKNHP